MTRKKVLIITYYWPPLGGVGVQRWLKMSKYFYDLGWEPIILTAKDPDFNILDPDLESQVHPETIVLRSKLFEPHKFYRSLVGKKNQKVVSDFGSEKLGLLGRFSLWVRSNFFIPDARMLWIKPSVKYLKKYLETNSVDVIVSTGPPHSAHLIAKHTSSKFNIPWVADFRDPWTNIDYFSELKLTKWALAKHHRLEREVLSAATQVVTVSPTWVKLFNKLGNRNDTVCITNGYDEVDFDISRQRSDGQFRMVHVGLLDYHRNPTNLWKAIANLKGSGSLNQQNFQLRLIGSVDVNVRYEIEELGLGDVVSYVAHLPHKEAIKEIINSDLSLLLINKQEDNSRGRLPSKLYEYIGAKSEMLTVAPNNKGDIVGILEDVKARPICLYSDGVEKFEQQIMDSFNDAANGNRLAGSDIVKYSRKDLARHYVEQFNEITKK